MGDILQYLNTTLLILNLGLVYIGVKVTLKHFKLQRTWSYIERFNHVDMLQPRLVATQFILEIEGMDKEQAIECALNLFTSKDAKEIEKRLNLDTFVNLFTELGIAHHAGAVNDVALEAIASLVVRTWKNINPYIIALRRQVAPYQVHFAFEELNNYILKKELHKTKETRRKGKVD